MNVFEERLVTFFDLPLPLRTEPLHVERAVVRFVNAQSIDFGSLCFLKRETSKRKPGVGRKVILSSLSQSRAKEILRIIELTSDVFGSGQYRPYALMTRYRQWAKFMDWCDANDHSGVLTNIANARRAYRAWAAEIRRQVDQHLLGQNTGAMVQRQVALVMEDFYEIDNITQGMNILAQTRDLVQPTPLPDDRAQAMILAWCTCLFRGFSDLVLNRTDSGHPESFPFALSVPEFANYPNNRLWVFPIAGWTRGADIGRVYDTNNGRLREVSDIEHLYVRPSYAVNAVLRARATLENANTNHDHPERLWRGMLACHAFHLLFLAVTGANATSAADVLWSEEMDAAIERPTSLRQGIRMIKYRAQGQVQQFEIGVEYMPYLKRYIELRKRLLMGKPWDYLFFTYVSNKPGPIGRYRPIRVHSFYELLLKLSPDLPKIPPRQWRASKQDHVIRQGDLALAARTMQHSMETAIRHYSNGSEITHQKEMGTYLGWVEKTKNAILDRGMDSVERSTGACTSPHNPSSIVEKPPIQPDCKRGEGCLFCDKYRIHADEKDCRKLVSARHCIRVAARYAGSMEEQEQIFGSILRALGFYLDLIRERDSLLISRIEREVDIEGELDPFWAAKLDTLIELGMDLQ